MRESMSDVKAMEVPPHEDLAELSRFWAERGIPHRISATAQAQVVWAREAAAAEFLRASYALWLRGQLPGGPEGSGAKPLGPGHQWGRLPLTLVGIALSVLGFLLVTQEGRLQLLGHFTFFIPVLEEGRWLALFPTTQPWRLLTPIFLHFSLLHIVFNMLWYWELGGRIERSQGSGRLLLVVLVAGVGSNLAQAWYTPGGLFGGMSGVIYALLGYCWVWGRLRQRMDLAVPKPVMIAMVAWLLICMVGFTELMGLGAVANAAHLGGLLLGLALGLVTALPGRR